jgi:Na+-translocating ferredoxin:NAD+ oxidoreductase RNF subunit RnfB
MRQIVSVLPKLNCGFCGFGNCVNYAKALVEGKAAPNRCIGGAWVAQKICDITGMKMPIAYPQMQYYPAERKRELWILQQELNNLERRVKALTTRMGG